ncbi:MAG: GNAT family acetyltransferase [Lachnospira sp.]|nr:GNAT family acetyltransferase [Lachnospira sp.]
MDTIDDFYVLNVGECFGEDGYIDEESLKAVIAGYECNINPDVNRFLKNNAIEFTKKHQSVTYLIFHIGTGKLVGYFTLAIKPITVTCEGFSRVLQKKIARVSQVDEESGELYLSAYLIAQLGKNFAQDNDFGITGEQLINIAMKQVEELQYMVGGTVVFLETEQNEKLLNYYEKENGFKPFRIRETKTRDGKKKKLLQMLKVIN